MRSGLRPAQWLGWGLAALVVAGVAYLAVQRGLLDGADLRGALPGRGQLCLSLPAGTSYIYSDQVTGTGQSFFYWWAWRLARSNALANITGVEPKFLARVKQQVTCRAGCERDGEPVCRRMKVNVSDPAHPGRFGRLLARYTCRRVKAVRQPHPGWRWGQWDVTVSCRALYGCNQVCVEVEPPVEAPEPVVQPQSPDEGLPPAFDGVPAIEIAPQENLLPQIQVPSPVPFPSP